MAESRYVKGTKSKTVKKTGYTKTGEKVTGLSIAKKPGEDHGLIVQWSHKNRAQTSGYTYDWEYWFGKRKKQTAAQKKKGKPGDPVWYPGGYGTVSLGEVYISGNICRYEFTAPDDALMVRIRIVPVAKTREVVVSVTTNTTIYSDGSTTSKKQNNKAQKPYYKGDWTAKKSHDFRNDKLSAPTVTVEPGSDGVSATVEVESEDLDTNYCDADISTRVWNSKTSKWDHIIVQKKYDKKCEPSARLLFEKLAKGTKYFIRARVQTTKAEKTASEWSSYQEFLTKPGNPVATGAKATGDNSASFSWNAVAGADTYTVQYVEGSKSYFDTNPSAVIEVTGITGTSFTPTGLESGRKWFFRVKAVNETGESGWSEIKDCVLATVPDAPTTYDTDPSYIVGDSVLFRWTHNSEDGSDQTQYQIMLDIYDSDGTSLVKTVRNISVSKAGAFSIPSDFASLATGHPKEAYFSGDETSRMIECSFKPSIYTDGIAFFLCDPENITFNTSNHTGNMAEELARIPSSSFASNPNIKLTGINYYTNHAAQTLDGTTDDSRAFNLSNMTDGARVEWKVRTKGAHSSWSPWSVTRRFFVYEQPSLRCALQQTDQEGQTVDEEHPLTSYPLSITLDASGGGGIPVSYHVVISAHEDTAYVDDFGADQFIPAGYVVWEGDFPTSDDPLNVLADVDSALFTDGGSYTVNASVSMASGLVGESDPETFAVDFDVDLPTPSALVVFDRDSLTAEIVPACMALDEHGEETGEYQQGVTLGVFRITADGDLVLLRRGIPNDGATTVIDPHAAFGECWYHIVARDTSTGISSIADVMDESWHGTCVIQFDEQWQQAGPDDEGDGGPVYGGTIIDRVYSLDFTESGDVEAEDIAYIGREDPVSYYGTQTGYTASYSLRFPKEDTETLQKVRKLMRLRDDCYIREPSGTGFWAHVRVTSRRSFEEGAIEVTIEATRVDRDDSALEGGE